MNQEELLKIIDQAAKDGRTELNLRGRNLTSLPAEIDQLKNLRTLNLGRNNLTSLPAEIGQLKNLTELDLGDNNLTSVPAVAVEMEGAKDVMVRVLFGPNDNAPTFAMRQFELAKSGHTPFHTHPFEHQAVILQGRVVLVSDQGERLLESGDVAMVMPNEKHQFKNLSDTEEAKMLCFIPIQNQK